MEYIKMFKNISQFEDFKNSSEWITPNVSYMVETTKCNFQPYVKPPYQLTWPVELINGDNGEKGIALYNYLVENYTPTPDNPYCFFDDILHLEIDKYVTHYHTGQNMLYWVDAYHYRDDNGGRVNFPCSYVLHPGNKILNWDLYPDGRCDVYYD